MRFVIFIHLTWCVLPLMYGRNVVNVIVEANEVRYPLRGGWGSAMTDVPLCAAVVSLALFLRLNF